MTNKKDINLTPPGKGAKKIPHVDIKKIEEDDIPPEKVKEYKKVDKALKKSGLKSLKESEQM